MEARLILGAAIVDDILATAVLSVVTTMVQTGDMTPNILDIYIPHFKDIRNICSIIYWSNIHCS